MFHSYRFHIGLISGSLCMTRRLEPVVPPKTMVPPLTTSAREFTDLTDLDPEPMLKPPPSFRPLASSTDPNLRSV